MVRRAGRPRAAGSTLAARGVAPPGGGHRTRWRASACCTNAIHSSDVRAAADHARLHAAAGMSFTTRRSAPTSCSLPASGTRAHAMAGAQP